MTEPRKPGRGSQSERILKRLREEPMCSSWGYENYIGRLAARIGELRNMGYGIVTTPCPKDHGHERVQYVTYTLVVEGSHPRLFADDEWEQPGLHERMTT